MIIIELTNQSSHKNLLQEFYDKIMVPEFPDDNERESIDNLLDYLDKKQTGWYDKNNYHVLVATEKGEIVGGIISDYFQESNSAAIEFVCVKPTQRKKGISRLLLQRTIDLLEKDAVNAGNNKLDLIVAEIENPKTFTGETSIPVETRAKIWSAFGFKRASFDYIQPPLSEDKVAVYHLWLIVREMNNSNVSTDVILSTLKNYMSLAMGIHNSEENVYFLRMKNQLSNSLFINTEEL